MSGSSLTLRNAQIPRPLYWRPIDYLRQLAAIGVSVKITRAGGSFHLGYRMHENSLAKFYAVKAAFPGDADWGADCLFAVIAITGTFVRDMPPGSERIVDLAHALVQPAPRAGVRHLLKRGVLQ